MRMNFREENKNLNMISQAFLPIVIYYFISNLFVTAGFSITQIVKTKAATEAFTQAHWFYADTLIRISGMALGGIAVYPYFKRENSDKESKRLSPKIALYLVGLGAMLSLGINFLFSVTGFTKSSEQYQQVAETQFALPLWLACIFYGVLSPVVEEMVFRGIVYRALCRSTTNVIAIIGSALLFGAFHGNVVQMLYAGIMGIGMAYIYQKYQSLWAPILFHGAANIAVYAVTYFF